MFKILHQRQTTRKKSFSVSPTDRQERISGWKQERLINGRALILGAGALGNEVVKNLALMGLGYMFLVDMDRIEHTNLSRAVLFRREDAIQKRYKVDVVSERAREINVTPGAFIQTFHGDLVWELGAGVFRRVDVVIGCLDNIEARITASENCLLTDTPYIDGGIYALSGNVTSVHAPHTACWICTTSAEEREQAQRDRYLSCTTAIQRAIEAGHVPTVQVASSIIAGFQAQEAVKVIQQLPWGAGQKIYYMCNGPKPILDVLTVTRDPDCWCNFGQPVTELLELDLSAVQHTLADLLEALEEHGYRQPDIFLPTRFVTFRICHACQKEELIMHPEFRLDSHVFQCSFCGASAEDIELQGFETIKTANPATELDLLLLKTRLIDLGFPRLAFISFATRGEDARMITRTAELSADASEVMGGLQYATVCPRPEFLHKVYPVAHPTN